MLTDKLPRRIKSAAFLRKTETLQSAFSTRPSSIGTHQQHFFQIPVSESRFTISGDRKKENVNKRSVSASRLLPLKTNFSTTSQIWRQVNSTRSQLRLKKLCDNDEESVRINLREKVQRIKGKHLQHEKLYQQCVKVISNKTLQRVRLIQQKVRTDSLHLKIMQLIAPFEQANLKAEERYRSRLFRTKKT